MTTFRVFISSSFLDFQNERNALHEKVFPKIEKLCEKHGSYFQAVDLRWGISEEEGKEYNTLDICLNEVKRATYITPKPNFLILAGDRYGWRPLPPQISEKLFKKIIKVASDDDKSILNSTYIKDLNSIKPIYVLRDKRQASENEIIVRKILDDIIENIHLSKDEIIEISSSATHREILARRELPEYISGNVHCFIRDLNHVPMDLKKEFYDVDEDGNTIPQSINMSADLKTSLKKAFPDAYCYSTDITEDGKFKDDELLNLFCDEVYNRLEKSIMEELDKLEENPMLDELTYHKKYAQKCHQSFYLGSRSKMKLPEMSRFRRLWKEDVVLIGEEGCGMSSLMGELAYRVSKRSRKSKVIIRFIGESGNSTDIDNLLRGILIECGVENAAFISEPQLYIQKHPFKSPVIILLDGIQKAKNPKWLIRYFMDNEDDNLRLYLSMNTEFYNSFAKKVKRKYHLVEVPPLEVNDAKKILKQSLALKERKLTRIQSDNIINAYSKKKDLKFLNDLVEDATSWKHDVTPQISTYTHEDVLRNYFKELEDENRINRILCLYTVRFLLSSREGLSDDELLDLLGRQDPVLDEMKKYSFHEFIERKIPFMYLSRFLETLRPFLKETLSEGKIVLCFADPVAIKIASEYAWNNDEEIKNEEMKIIRLEIASYFETKVDDIFNTMIKAILNSYHDSIGAYRIHLNSRIALEYPWQLFKTDEYEKLYHFISNRKYFNLLCDKNLSDMLTYWTAVERNTTYSIKESFNDIFIKAQESIEPEDSTDKLIIRPLLDLLIAHGGFDEEILLLNQTNTNNNVENSDYTQGQSLLNTEKYDEAIELSENMMSNSSENSIQGFDALYIKAQALYRTEKYQDALVIFIKLESIARNLEERSRIFTSLKWQASCYKAMGMKDDAMDIYMVLEDYVDEDSDIDDVIVTLFEAATGIAMFQNMYEGAEKLIVAMNMAEKLGNRTWLLTIYEKAITLFSLSGDYSQKTEEVFNKWMRLKLEENPHFELRNENLSNYLNAVHEFLPEKTAFTIELYNLMKKTGGIIDQLKEDRTPHGKFITKIYEYILENMLPSISSYIEAQEENVEYFRDVINNTINEIYNDYDKGTNDNYQKILDIIQDQDSQKELSDEDLRLLNFILMGISIKSGLKDCLTDSLASECIDSARMVMGAYNNVYIIQHEWWRNNIAYNSYRMRLDYFNSMRKKYDEINEEYEKMLEVENPIVKSIYDNLIKQRKEHESKK